jgi:maltose O-acetyltransferase
MRRTFVTVRAMFMRMFGLSPIPPGATVGRGAFIGLGVMLDQMHGPSLTIGEEATLVQGCTVLCHDASSNRRLGTTFVAPVRIGRRAFLGANSIILPGVTIGDDAIVAAGAVVTADVEAGTVVAGCPARKISLTADVDERRRAEMSTLPNVALADWRARGVAAIADESLRGSSYVIVDENATARDAGSR